MKIVCIAPSRIPSVTANSIQAMKVCQALAQIGHEVILIAPGSGPEGATAEEKWDVLADHYGLHTRFECEFIPPFDGWLPRRVFPWRAVQRARQLGAEVIYTWLIQSAIGGMLYRLPVVLEMHDLPLGTFGPIWYRRFLKMKGRKRQLVITQALQEALAAQYRPQLKPAENMLAPNGVDLERYQRIPTTSQARAILGLPEIPTVACTGHLYAGRGAELYLELAPRMPEVHFVWVGGRPQHVEEWRRKTEEMGIINISFVGFIPNAILPMYQAAAEVLLMPYGLRMGASSGENPVEFFNPMKMFEYMASGRPVITSDLPVISEILGRDSAVFCPPENLIAWEEAIYALLGNPLERERLAANARKDVLPYTWKARAEKAFEGWS